MDHIQTADNAELNAASPALGDVLQKPVWSFNELAQIFGLPISTLEQILREQPAPFFLMGRRRFIKRADAMDWLDDIAASNQHIPRRNNRHIGGAL